MSELQWLGHGILFLYVIVSLFLLCIPWQKNNGQPFGLSVTVWRCHPESNWGSRSCSPLPYRLAMAPYGADDEARTRYLHLGKVALYQMSYIRIFCFFVFVCSLTTMFIIRENPPFVNNILKVFLKNFFEPENGAAPHSEAAPCSFVGIQNL